jgi:hypothetical protein
MAGGATDGVPVAAVRWLLNAVGFAATTYALLRATNDEFDLPPLPRA